MAERMVGAGAWLLALLWAAAPAAAEVREALWVFLRDKDGGRIAWQERPTAHADVELDAPVEPRYVEQVRLSGALVRTCSRWLNAVSVEATPAERQRLQDLPFVLRIETVRAFRRPDPDPGRALPAPRPALQGEYGPAFAQMAQLNVIGLHERGFGGEGVRIAILDNGFHYIEHPAFSRLRVVAARDFINGDEVVSDQVGQWVTGNERVSGQNLHGAQVLSLLAGNDPGNFLGVAPDAEYVLAKTEDNGSEMPIEEDRWIAGLEWADSLGARVLNSSLGYNIWDDGTGYAYAEIDGRTARTSQAAALAARRGMVVVVAAGNEADQPWHYVTAPADAEGVIAVGSVDVPQPPGVRLPRIAFTSSRGPTADGRIKPDLVAPGEGVVVADVRGGGYRRSGGTSFATPLVSGVCALLLQIHPEWGPQEVLEALRTTAVDLGEAGADTIYGWGQVDALAASGLDLELPEMSRAAGPFPNPSDDGVFHFPLQLAEQGSVELSVFDLAGNLVDRQSWVLAAGVHLERGRAPRWNAPGRLENGLYFYRLRAPGLDVPGKIALVRARR